MDSSAPRFVREKETLRKMVGLYCRDKHGGDEVPCAVCRELLDYAHVRLEKCPFGADKPKCSACTIHCYKPEYRARVQEVMRYAGPRMLTAHPILAIQHVVDGIRHRAPKRKKPKPS